MAALLPRTPAPLVLDTDPLVDCDAARPPAARPPTLGGAAEKVSLVGAREGPPALRWKT